MAIVVKHEVGAGAVAAGSFAGGQGETRNKFQMGQLQAEEERKRLASQQEFRAGESALGRQQQFDLQESAQVNRNEDADSAVTRKEDASKRAWSVAQQRKKAESDAAHATIDGDVTLTPEEMVIAHQKQTNKDANLGPPSGNKILTPKERHEKDVYTDATGNIWVTDPVTKKRTIAVKAQTPIEKAKSIADVIKTLREAHTDKDNVFDETGYNRDIAKYVPKEPAAPSPSAAEGTAEQYNRENPLDIPVRGAPGTPEEKAQVEADAQTSGVPPGGEKTTTPGEDSVAAILKNPKARAVWDRMTQAQRDSVRKRAKAPEPDKPDTTSMGITEPGKGSKLTPKVAKQYQKKYGSREAAEAAAKKDGWSF